MDSSEFVIDSNRYVEVGYDKFGVMRNLVISLNGLRIRDTVLYTKKGIFFIEQYRPLLSKTISNAYIVRRVVDNKTISYWLGENDGKLVLGYVDTAVSSDTIFRHVIVNSYFIDIDDFVNGIDVAKNFDLADGTFMYYFTTDSDGTAINAFVRMREDDMYYGFGNGKYVCSSMFSDSTIYRLVQYVYGYPNILDPISN